MSFDVGWILRVPVVQTDLEAQLPQGTLHVCFLPINTNFIDYLRRKNKIKMKT